MTRSSEQMQSPRTPPAMQVRMASPCFPEASRAGTGSLTCSDFTHQQDLAQLTLSSGRLGCQPPRRFREVLKSPLWSGKQCGAFPSWGLAARACCSTWHGAGSQVSSLETEPETEVRMPMMHCGNALRRTCQGEKEEEGRKGAQEGRGLGESLALIWATGGLWSANYTSVLTCLGARDQHFVYLGPLIDRPSRQTGDLFSCSSPSCDRFPRDDNQMTFVINRGDFLNIV